VNRIRCDLLPERARESYLARSGLRAVSRKKNLPEDHLFLVFFIPYNKSFIDQAWSVKIAGNWSRSFLCVFMDHKLTGKKKEKKKKKKKKLAQNPPNLTPFLVKNPKKKSFFLY